MLFSQGVSLFKRDHMHLPGLGYILQLDCLPAPLSNNTLQVRKSPGWKKKHGENRLGCSGKIKRDRLKTTQYPASITGVPHTVIKPVVLRYQLEGSKRPKNICIRR